jgi:dUTPase
MRINPNGIPTPRPIAKDLEFEEVEDGDEVAEELLVEVVTVDIFVVEVLAEEVDVEVDVRTCPCRRTIVPTGIEKELPDSQQLVLFGPQQ